MLPDEIRGPGALLTRSSRGLRVVASVLWAGGAVPVLSGIICPGIDWSWCGLMVLLTTSKMISLASWTQVTTQSESSWQVNHKNTARCFLDKVRWWVGWGVPSIRALQSIASPVTSLLGPPDWEPARLCLPPRVWSRAWQCGNVARFPANGFWHFSSPLIWYFAPPPPPPGPVNRANTKHGIVLHCTQYTHLQTLLLAA